MMKIIIQNLIYNQKQSIDKKTNLHRQMIFFKIFTLKSIVFHLCCILPLLFQGSAKFVLTSITMLNSIQTFTQPYNRTLTVSQPKFAYFVDSGIIRTSEFRIMHWENQTFVSSSQITIKFQIQNYNTMSTYMGIADMLNIKILITDYPQSTIAINMVSTSPPGPISISLPLIQTQQMHTFRPSIFTLCFSMTYTFTVSLTHLSIIPTYTPVHLTTISFSYIIVTRTFLLHSVGVFFSQIHLGNMNAFFNFGNYAFINPSESNSVLGINMYKCNTVFDVQQLIFYDDNTFPHPTRTLFWFYTVSNGVATVLQTTGFFFDNQLGDNCPDGNVLSYANLFTDTPLMCSQCDPHCLTCTTWNQSISITDGNSCTSCGPMKYLYLPFYPHKGQCICWPGLQMNMSTLQCIPCSINCLNFQITFMKSSTNSQFFLAFNQPTTLYLPIQQNLLITMNNSTTPISYTITAQRQSIYRIYLDIESLNACVNECDIQFRFAHPELVGIDGQGMTLSMDRQWVKVEGFYKVGSILPEQTAKAMMVTSVVVGASMSGGLSSMLKMLFQLEQFIDYHKYLNLELPLLFKDFVQSLSSFRFLDVTTIIPFQLNSLSQNISTKTFDLKGPTSSLYYDNGCNFYKNIIPILLSMFIILLINFSIFFFFRIIPCKLLWTFSQKLRIRKLITLSDLSQTIIMPVVLYCHFQLTYVIFQFYHFWIYLLMFACMTYVLLLPFMIATYIYVNKDKSTHQTREIYEDLIQDCSLDQPLSYVFYVVGFYRKIVFTLILLHTIEGIFQGPFVILLNLVYLFIIVYVIYRKIYFSTVKMIIKLSNLLCIIVIQAIMVYYNLQQNSLADMVTMGTVCVYFAIASTIIGTLQAFFKLGQILLQNVNRQKNAQVNAKNILQMQNDKKQLNVKRENMVAQQLVRYTEDKLISTNEKNTMASTDSKDLKQQKRRKKTIGRKPSLFNRLMKNSTPQDQNRFQTKLSNSKHQQSYEQFDLFDLHVENSDEGLRSIGKSGERNVGKSVGRSVTGIKQSKKIPENINATSNNREKDIVDRKFQAQKSKMNIKRTISIIQQRPQQIDQQIIQIQARLKARRDQQSLSKSKQKQKPVIPPTQRINPIQSNLNSQINQLKTNRRSLKKSL